MSDINLIASGSDTNDSDFAASDSYGSDYDSSSSEDRTRKVGSTKPTGKSDEALASGDEGIVESGKRKRRKKHKKKGKGKANKPGDENEYEDDEGTGNEGVGARLRRRKEGRAERETNKPTLGTLGAATIDIDDIWMHLKSAPAKPTPAPLPSSVLDPAIDDQGPAVSTATGSGAGSSLNGLPVDLSEMITIKRTYTFAGTTTTEEKLVRRESAEARLYLASQSTESPHFSSTESSATKRILRRPLRRPSRFDEPNPPGGSYLRKPTVVKTQLAPTAVNTAGMSAVQRKLEQGQKLNTVEKSKLDWAGYVDKEKLKDELDVAEKAKGSYLDRMEFLGRSEQAREEVLREGRMK